jgi:hypothetical protein
VSVDKVRPEDWVVGGLALLLAVALLLFPWFTLTISFGTLTASASATATAAPDGWTAVLGMVAAIAVVADLAVERVLPHVQIPTIGDSREETRFVLAAIAATFTALKFLLHIHFDLFGWGFYVAIATAAALVYFAARARQGAGSLA